jgi:hypothetical protein
MAASRSESSAEINRSGKEKVPGSSGTPRQAVSEEGCFAPVKFRLPPSAQSFGIVQPASKAVNLRRLSRLWTVALSR